MAAPLKRRSEPNKLSRMYRKVADFDPLSLFAYKRGKPYPREVLVNVPPPPESIETAPRFAIPGLAKTVEEVLPDGSTRKKKVKRGFGSQHVPAHGWIHASNQVLTSKYNVITFLPRNLIEQFRRYANIYFLCTS